jgi:HEAT repeat protein
VAAASWVRRLWPAAGFQCCFIAALALLKPAANALVLSRFNTALLPWLYIAASLITGGLAVTGARSTRRPSPVSLSAMGGLTALALAAGAWLDVPGVSITAYLFSEALGTQVSLAFWGQVADAFDAREARRAFTWINGVGMSGAILGGAVAQALARHAGALALLVVGGALLSLGAVVMQFHRSALEPPGRSAAELAPWRDSLRSRYLRLLAAFVVAYATLQIFTDFVFRERAVASLDEADMAALFASHQLWTGVVCVAFQFLLAEGLLKRLGLLRYLGLVPAILGGLVVTAWVVPTVWTAWALKVAEGTVSWAVLPVAMQLLYAPLPDAVRDGARRTIDGLLRKGGVGLAGLVLLGVGQLAGAPGVLAAAAGVCGVMGLAVWRIRPRYVEAVQARVAGASPTEALLAEEGLLLEALASPSAERVLRAVELLELAGLVREAQVRALLEHPQALVRERGVALAQAGGVTSASRALEALIAGPERRPRDAAVWALSRLNPQRAAAVLPPLLGSQDIGLRCAAAGGLLSIDEARFPEATRALEELLGRLPLAPPAERRELAKLLGQLAPTPTRENGLRQLLDDAEPSVRRLAIEAIGRARVLDLAPRLLRFLSWRDERGHAREALAALGDQVVPLLAAALDDRQRALSVRVQLPRVLRRVATQAAFDALLFSSANDDPSLHYRVGVALAQVHDQRPRIDVHAPRVLDALRRRRDTSLSLVQVWVDLRAVLGEASLLTRVLKDRLDQSLELSVWLLGLLHEARGLRRAYAHLVGPDARRRAWALELFDALLTQEEQALVRPQLELWVGALPPAQPRRLEASLELLTHSDDFVLRACARKVARWLGHWHEPFREDDMNEHTVRKLFALEGVEIFAQSDVDDLAAVAAVAREEAFRKGEQVYAEGDPGDALYVIVEGSVEARREGEVVLSMGARESFGETSLFDGAPRINEVVALADTRTLVIDRRDFLDLLADRPELLAGMFRVLSRQLKSMVVEVAARRATTGEMLAVREGVARSGPKTQ